MNRLIGRRVAQDLQQIEDQGGWDQAYQRRYFAPWSWLQHRDRCEHALPELKWMADDHYAHELTPFLAYVLYQAIETWIGLATSSLNVADERDRAAWKRDLRALNDLMDSAFHNTDFLHTDSISASILEGTAYVPHLGIDPSDFLELMPDDIRLRVEEALRPGNEPDAPECVDVRT
jgi:hypothetical protein